MPDHAHLFIMVPSFWLTLETFFNGKTSYETWFIKLTSLNVSREEYNKPQKSKQNNLFD